MYIVMFIYFNKYYLDKNYNLNGATLSFIYKQKQFVFEIENICYYLYIYMNENSF